jgi:hypothetical protein
MNFIVILERDESVQETYINYLQWTDNEAEILQLIRHIKAVSTADLEQLDPSYNRFYVANTFIPEAVVDMHMALVFNNGIPNPYYKYAGVFKCPSFMKKDTIEESAADDEPPSHERWRGDSIDSEDTYRHVEPAPIVPPRRDSTDMELDDVEDVEGEECAYRLSHYFSANGFSNYFTVVNQ